jgi:hypothetical protein
LVAYTEIEYAVPLFKGEIVQEVPVPVVLQELPPGWASTSYLVMEDPLFVEADQVTVIWPSPGEIETILGAAGDLNGTNDAEV